MPQTVSPTHSAHHGKFIWCELMTTDIEAAGKFYSSVVGWTVTKAQLPDLPDIDMPYFLFEMGEGDDCPGIGGLMALPPELEGKIPPNWTGYVAVDDVDETARAFAENGGGVQRQPEDIPGIGRFAVVADPHGAVICIMTPLPQENPPPELPFGAPGSVGWRELYAGNGEEAFDFYAKVFGWTKDSEFDMGPLGLYRVFAHDGRMAGGIMTKPAEVPAPFWGYYFTVEAIDAAAARVTAAGGKIVFGPEEVPGGSWIVNCIDPHGAFFALIAATR